VAVLTVHTTAEPPSFSFNMLQISAQRKH